jgi:hypothetical protein
MKKKYKELNELKIRKLLGEIRTFMMKEDSAKQIIK